jgi:hypothetical protein
VDLSLLVLWVDAEPLGQRGAGGVAGPLDWSWRFGLDAVAVLKGGSGCVARVSSGLASSV